MKKFTFILLILVLPALLFAAGGRQQASGDGGYLRFAWWGNTTRDERTVRVTQLFMEKNPGVVVETEPTQWDGYWQRMNTQAAAGSLPDVMQQDLGYIKQYADRNQLEDLNAYAQRGLIDLSHWPDAGLAAGRLNNRLNGLVLGTNAWCIGVDPAVLQQAGLTIDDTTWTWADYERIALQVYQRTGVQTMPHSIVQTMENITRQFGDGMYAADDRSLGMTHNQAAINAYRAVLEMELRLRAAGALYDPESAFILGLAFEETALVRGRTWNGFFWSNQHIGFQNAAGRPLEYLMYPSVQGPRAPFGLYFRASQFISMLASAENKDLAARFIDFFVNDLEANQILLAERGVPVPTNVREDLYNRVDAGNRYLFQYITKITPFASPADPPYPSGVGEVEDTIRPIILQILTSRLAPDAGVAQLIQASNAVLSR